jgi:hypothetical protein
MHLRDGEVNFLTHSQYGGAFETPGTQVVESLVGRGQRVDMIGGLDRHLGRNLQECDTVFTR